MVAVILRKTVVLSKPVLDDKNKQVKVTATHKGRLIDINAFDNEHHEAGKVIEVSDAVAKEIIEAGAAALYDDDQAALG